jgi:hypothetical protein
LWIVPIVGKEISLFNENKTTAKKHKLIIIVVRLNSTISCPIHGTALIRFVIQKRPKLLLGGCS